MEKSTALRINVLYVLFTAVAIIFGVRLFYIQVVNGSDYSEQALASQQKKYEIPAERGKIYIQDGNDGRVPLVLNQKLKTLYADPRYVDDPEATAKALVEITGGDVNRYVDLLSIKDRVYVVLDKKLSEAKSRKIEALKLNGIGLQDATYRVYPEGNLAAQIVGFVNDEGIGQYGIEEALDDVLSGENGLLKSVTDVRGIPLTTNDQSVVIEPKDGEDVVLTIDRNVQKFVEQALERGVKHAEGKSGSAIVVDPNSGAIIAMANYPTYNPAKFFEVKPADQGVFINGVVSSAYEVGSVMKPFTMSAGLNEGVVTKESTYYDPGYVQVDDRRIENAGVASGVTRTMAEVIEHSVNTGAVHVLQELSGGNDEINETGRKIFYDYLTNHYGFGAITGVEQTAEAPGLIYPPDSEQGNNVRYANMTFGQGLTATMIQMCAAYSALVNGGTYYQPYMVEGRIDPISGVESRTSPRVIRDNVIKASTSESIREMMELVVQGGGGYSAKRSGYRIGGKTGTSQVVNENGTYSNYRENGSFIGFGAGNDVSYVIMTKVEEPKIYGYAGTVAAAPIFAEISNWLIDYYQIPPVND